MILFDYLIYEKSDSTKISYIRDIKDILNFKKNSQNAICFIRSINLDNLCLFAPSGYKIKILKCCEDVVKIWMFF